MSKLYRVYEDTYDPYPLAVTEEDKTLLLHEELVVDPDEEYWEDKGARYSGLITEGQDRYALLARVPMEWIERRLNEYEHVDGQFWCCP